MIEITVTKFSRNLRKMFDRIEYGKEEIILVRKKQRIARIIPGSSHLTAQEAMRSLYKTLTDAAAENWLQESRLPDTLEGVENKWDS